VLTVVEVLKQLITVVHLHVMIGLQAVGAAARFDL
jgi:hypothetical protein